MLQTDLQHGLREAQMFTQLIYFHAIELNSKTASITRRTAVFNKLSALH
jgi:hypothetical protein